MKFLKSLLLTASTAVTFAGSASSPDWGPADTVACYNVGPGIEYTKIIYHERPLIIWYTTIDLTNPYNQIEHRQSRNQVPDVNRWDIETFYRECSSPGHQVKVAWNHDFFVYEQGICIGMNVSDGRFTNLTGGRSMLAITKDRHAEVFRAPVAASVIAADGTEVGIDMFNNGALGMTGDCVFYNSLNSTMLSGEGTFIKVRPLSAWVVNGANTPCEVVEVSTSPLQTSATECVVWLRGAKANALNGHVKPGDRIGVKQGFGQPNWGIVPKDIVAGFHGYPSIAHDGKLHDGEYDDFEDGREYENSSHVMAGLSKDKKTLYICLNEMSVQSQPINCVEMAEWMLARGAWDIVNFDSGGSAAIALNGTMQNLPGRGSVRPVQDAMLAVSIAPEDQAVASLGFTKKRISPSTISLEPLSVVSYNRYGDIVEEGVEGCTFTVVPSTLGTVDSDGVFHSSAEGGFGKIIAEKDGVRGEMEVFTRQASDIRVAYPSLLLDGTRDFFIPVLGTVNGATYALDAGAFEWTAGDPTVVALADGMVKGLKNGKTTIMGTFGDVSLNIDVTVEIGEGRMAVYDFKNLATDTKVKMSGVKNLTAGQPLPDGWTEGVAFTADASGRSRKITVSFDDLTLYGLPCGVSVPVDNRDGFFRRFTLVCVDHLGARHMQEVDLTSETKEVEFEFKQEGELLDVPQYPMQIKELSIYLNTAAEAYFALGNLSAVYPEGSGSVERVVADSQLSVMSRGDRLSVEFEAESAGSAEVAVYASNGVKVLSQDVTAEAGQNCIELGTMWLPAGVYICTADVDGRCMAKKFIKR